MGVSNPLRSPRFRTSASVKRQRVAFAFELPPGIYEFHLSSRNSTLLSLTLVDPKTRGEGRRRGGEVSAGSRELPASFPPGWELGWELRSHLRSP